MAKAYDGAQDESSVRLLAQRLAQSSLSQETATVHVLPSTCTPGSRRGRAATAAEQPAVLLGLAGCRHAWR